VVPGRVPLGARDDERICRNSTLFDRDLNTSTGSPDSLLNCRISLDIDCSSPHFCPGALPVDTESPSISEDSVVYTTSRSDTDGEWVRGDNSSDENPKVVPVKNDVSLDTSTSEIVNLVSIDSSFNESHTSAISYQELSAQGCFVTPRRRRRVNFVPDSIDLTVEHFDEKENINVDAVVDSVSKITLSEKTKRFGEDVNMDNDVSRTGDTNFDATSLVKCLSAITVQPLKANDRRNISIYPYSSWIDERDSDTVKRYNKILRKALSAERNSKWDEAARMYTEALNVCDADNELHKKLFVFKHLLQVVE